MFYCDKCAEKKGWNESIFKSLGKCEVCGEHGILNSVKSSLLPRGSGDDEKPKYDMMGYLEKEKAKKIKALRTLKHEVNIINSMIEIFNKN